MAKARMETGPNQVLLGNIEPAGILRNGQPADVYAAIAECHCQVGQRYIVSAGCEVCRDTPVENVRAMLEYARSHKDTA
jgi:uroporphyrinogen decarboxylase